jgi:mRNA interferase HicA
VVLNRACFVDIGRRHDVWRVALAASLLLSPLGWQSYAWILAPLTVPPRSHKHNICVDYTQHLCCSIATRDKQSVQAVVAKQGCTFEPGHGGHLIVRRSDRISVLPMHGSGKELGTGLVSKVKKDLGLK